MAKKTKPPVPDFIRATIRSVKKGRLDSVLILRDWLIDNHKYGIAKSLLLVIERWERACYYYASRPPSAFERGRRQLGRWHELALWHRFVRTRLLKMIKKHHGLTFKLSQPVARNFLGYLWDTNKHLFPWTTQEPFEGEQQQEGGSGSV